LKTDEISTVFDRVEDNQPLKSLFITNASYNYWLKDGENIVLTTIDNSKEVLIILNVLTKKIQIVPFDLENVNILNLKNNLLVVSGSSPNQIPVVKICQIDLTKPIVFHELKTKKSTKLDGITYRLIKQNEDKLLDQIQTIVVGPTDTFNKPTPSIIIPHGGMYFN
jgi:hypothetical protein